MIFTNEILDKMANNKMYYNSKYSRYYYSMYKSSETKEKSIFEKGRRIGSCMDYWQWNAYHKNKVLDLKKVNRCMNNRFCPNCKKIDLSKFIHKFKDVFEQYNNYSYYFLTLTIPNCDGEKLNETIDKLNDTFAKFKEKFSYPKLTNSGNQSKKAYQDRLIDIAGGVRVLEINYNQKKGYHPHLHCVVLTEKPVKKLLMLKKHKARYSTKRETYDYKSDIEIQISKIWSFLFYGLEISKKNLDNIEFKVNENYFDNDKKVLEVDFKEFDKDGLYEVFKYTFKDTEIENYKVFEQLNNALLNRRIRQGFGNLYNLKTEDIDIGEQQPLELEIEEIAEDLINKSIIELFSLYQEYKKISRFNTQIDNNIRD